MTMTTPESARELVALASVGRAEPPAEGTVVVIHGQDWPIRYSSSLKFLGVVGGFDFNGRPVNEIRLREWNERVFLHEVLHVILDHSNLDLTDPEHWVQALEDALWEMGWRWVGDTPIPPASGDTP